jgi:hypothetical protein
MARRVDDVTDRARTRLAVTNRAADELAELRYRGRSPRRDAPRRRRHMLDDLALELGR